MQIIVSDQKSGRSYRIDIPKEKEGMIIGRKIGEQLDGGIFGAAGYQLRLTGGSDSSGFPMRADVSGIRKDRILLSKGVGFREKRKGARKRRIIRGNVYSADTVQVNAIVVERGEIPLEKLFAKEEKKE